MTNNKYTLLRDDVRTKDFAPVFRIKALKSFNNVKKGDLGGYIDEKTNLSHDGNAWIYDDAVVVDSDISDNAVVKHNALVDASQLKHNAVIQDKTCVIGSVITENARVQDQAMVRDEVLNTQDIPKVRMSTYMAGNSVVKDNAFITGGSLVDEVVVAEKALLRGAIICSRETITHDIFYKCIYHKLDGTSCPVSALILAFCTKGNKQNVIDILRKTEHITYSEYTINKALKYLDLATSAHYLVIPEGDKIYEFATTLFHERDATVH